MAIIFITFIHVLMDAFNLIVLWIHKNLKINYIKFVNVILAKNSWDIKLFSFLKKKMTSFKFQALFVTYTTIQRLYNQQWNVKCDKLWCCIIVWRLSQKTVQLSKKYFQELSFLLSFVFRIILRKNKLLKKCLWNTKYSWFYSKVRKWEENDS